MHVAQITIRLPPGTKTAFERYARSLGLDASELAKLLITREQRVQRLLKLAQMNRVPKTRRQSNGKATRLPTVTAHLSSREDVVAFDDYAQRCGLNRNGAGAWLLETELKERWLEAVIIWLPQH